MTQELKPWLDQDVPPELRRLLEAGRADEPSLEPLQHALALVTVTSAVSDVSSTSALTSGSVTSSAIVGSKWFILGGGLLSVIAVGVAVVAVPQSSAPPNPRPIVTSTFTTPTNTRTPIRSIATGSNELPPSKTGQAVEPTRPSKWANKRRTIPPPVATLPLDTPPAIEKTAPSLSGNTTPMPALTVAPKESQSSFVDRARIALGRRQYAETLAILNQYELAYQTRTFAPEALQLRMRTYLWMGNDAAAKKVAESLTHLYPSTPQGKDARELLEK